ncbi:hypothetical protein VaNZ11_009754, partial [Volvox africanus]
DENPCTHDAVLEHVRRSGVGSIESQLTGLQQSLAAVQVMLIDMQLRQKHEEKEQPQPQPLQHAQSVAGRRNSAAKTAAAAMSVAPVVPQPLPSPSLHYYKRSTAGGSAGADGVMSGVNENRSGPRGLVAPLTHGSRYCPDVGHVTSDEQTSAAGASSLSREVSQQRGLMADMTQTQQVIRSQGPQQVIQSQGPQEEHDRNMRSYGQDKREYVRKLQPATSTASDAAMLQSVSQQLSQLLPQHLLSRQLQQLQQLQQQHHAPKVSGKPDIPPEYRIWRTAAFRACTGESH